MSPYMSDSRLPTSELNSFVHQHENEKCRSALQDEKVQAVVVDSPRKGGNYQYRKEWTSVWSRRRHDMAVLIGALILMIWPWLFWGIVRHKKGRKLSNQFAPVAKQYPEGTAFFVSLVATFFAFLVNTFFTVAVIRFSEEWVADGSHKITLFRVSVFNAFRHQDFPWYLSDLSTVMRRNRWPSVLLVTVLILTFNFAPSGITSLLLPVPFPNVDTLSGKELDLSSIDPTCLEWYKAQATRNTVCEWRGNNGSMFQSCLGPNQLPDMLTVARSSILGLAPGNDESMRLDQLGILHGTQVAGPLRGILPSGLNGAPTVHTLRPSVFDVDDTRRAMQSYNYTLNLQGIEPSNVVCNYADFSPIRFRQTVAESPFTLDYNATCPDGATEVFDVKNLPLIVGPNSASGIGYWACRAFPTDAGLPSYYIYLQGRGGYADKVGNVTCLVTGMQAASYPTTYQSNSGVIRVGSPINKSPTINIDVADLPFLMLRPMFADSQNMQINTLTETIFTFGTSTYNYPTTGQHNEYLQLHAALLKWTIDYMNTYNRLVLSNAPNTPPVCLRQVSGTVSYMTLGWYAKLDHVWFLLPITFMGLASVGTIIAAMVMSKADNLARLPDPTDAGYLLDAPPPAHPQGNSHAGDKWERLVSFQQRA